MMSRLLTLIAVLILTTACSTKKIIYVASTLTDCENNPSEKCIQVKENKEDEWTVLNNNIEDFEHKDGFLQKIEVSINKNKSTNASELSYTFIKLIYEQKEDLKSMTITQNYTEKWQVNKIVGIDSLATQPTLIFKDGKASGNAGCNNYDVAFNLSDNEITFGVATATKRSCMNALIEKAYFDCLAKTKKYKLLDDSITFYDVNNAELMQCNKLKQE